MNPKDTIINNFIKHSQHPGIF